jgi:hypothetical protein
MSSGNTLLKSASISIGFVVSRGTCPPVSSCGGTIEQEPFAHGTKPTVPSSAPLSLASYDEVMSGLPQIPSRCRWLLRMPSDRASQINGNIA